MAFQTILRSMRKEQKGGISLWSTQIKEIKKLSYHVKKSIYQVNVNKIEEKDLVRAKKQQEYNLIRENILKVKQFMRLRLKQDAETAYRVESDRFE